MELPFNRFPSVFVRLKGRNGNIRECRALVDPGSDYCLIPKVDAYALGYPEAANDDPMQPADNTVTVASYDGFGKAALVVLETVEIGEMSFKDIDFIAFDLPQATGFDAVIGRSLLQYVRLQMDYAAGSLTITRAGKPGEKS